MKKYIALRSDPRLAKAATSRLTDTQLGLYFRICVYATNEDPEINYAVCKTKIKGFTSAETTNNIINLVNAGFINSNIEPVAVCAKTEAEIDEVIHYFNEVTNGSAKVDTKSYRKTIDARLQEYSVDDCKIVIANRNERWANDASMSKYLRISTLFKPTKFPTYLEDAKTTGIGMAKAQEAKIDIKEGDVLTKENTEALHEEVYYNVRVQQGFSNVFNLEKRNGKAIKATMRRSTGVRMLWTKQD